ncbi:PREDICTED: uncharacterized protein LOC100640414 isoform X2 [Amphimedon queenslandica]|uniref:Macro domain-containing protein n=1 Tax=Amphimedon queenslandica TaxID=400682 RepID=A0AAN0J4N4_AMPQE|nr:PREDICTED: uncharacterized protein LOC100640414 isoform X2 [Amphimedon queenslandica]|eukprot:XP_019851965.1 PREDICTED: uncharacterized protein LOC100640414 isoform X2 [Amphimedon queenslandica]
MAESMGDPVKESDGGGGEATNEGEGECKEKGEQATCKLKLDRRSQEERKKEGNSKSRRREKRLRERMNAERPKDVVNEEREAKPGGAEGPQGFIPSKEEDLQEPKYPEKKEWPRGRDKHLDRRYDDHGGYYDGDHSRHRKDEDERDHYGRHGDHHEGYRHDERLRYDERPRYDGGDRHREYGQYERHRQGKYGEGHRRGGGGKGPRRHEPKLRPKPTLPPGVTSFRLEELDLFDSPASSSLAHCVSEDMHMGKGIAVAFKKKFKRVDQLLEQGVKTGGVAVLEDNKRYIYYLVTKKKYFHRPTNDTLKSSLSVMREHIVANGVKELHMPLIGCGLDELDWYTDVAYMIDEIFKDIKDLKITVCYLGE